MPLKTLLILLLTLTVHSAFAMDPQGLPYCQIEVIGNEISGAKLETTHWLKSMPLIGSKGLLEVQYCRAIEADNPETKYILFARVSLVGKTMPKPLFGVRMTDESLSSFPTYAVEDQDRV